MMRFLLLLISAAGAFSQTTDPEPAAILEFGASTAHDFSGGWNLGPSVAVEFTPIEDRLEIETGVTAAFRRHAMEWDTDLLFKKPWTISEKFEFMLGIGPEWVHARSRGVVTNSPGIEFAPDLMFWPSGHRFGWYLEPSYDRTFGSGRGQSIGITAGLLIAIPRPGRLTN